MTSSSLRAFAVVSAALNAALLAGLILILVRTRGNDTSDAAGEMSEKSESWRQCDAAPSETLPVRNAEKTQSKLYFSGSQRQQMYMNEGLLRFDKNEFEFALVSDLDLKSRDPQRFRWFSYLKRGVLHRKTGHRDGGGSEYSVTWKETHTLETFTAKKNRSMELSELVQFNHRLLAMCDYTGLVFKIDMKSSKSGREIENAPCAGVKQRSSNPSSSTVNVFQRYAIADGNGDKVKPCKMEWATVKDGVLWVGSIGKEWTATNAQGESVIVHRDPEWVKTIDDSGRVQNYNWGAVYAALRTATNTTFPGYLWHEAVHWDPRMRRWVFLPRKASESDPYEPTADERKGTNLLIFANEDFTDINVLRVGGKDAAPADPERGFTAIRKVPGTANDFMALQVREVAEETATWILIFDGEGNVLLPPQLVASDVKFEGLEFI